MLMRKINLLLISAISMAFSSQLYGQNDNSAADIVSMSALEFSEDGVLFIGDSKAGMVHALQLNDNTKSENEESLQVFDLEGKIGALLGTTGEDILIHDMAVNPISQNTYFSVSRARANWTSNWQLPNELTDSNILVRLTPSGEFSEVDLQDVELASIDIPNPVDNEKEHKWKKGTKLRAEAITDLALHRGNLYVAGLSNEEFASSMWVMPYPFQGEASMTTLEIYHGAHGAYETHAPIRTFLPYELNDKDHMMAAYLCTPLVTFETDQFSDGDHLKGRTVAEFGSGNYPIDMISYKSGEEEYIMMSNSQLPLLIIDPKDVESFEGEITTEVKGYLGGVKYTPRSGAGIYHIADFNAKYILATQRMANGKMALSSLSKNWMRP